MSGSAAGGARARPASARESGSRFFAAKVFLQIFLQFFVGFFMCFKRKKVGPRGGEERKREKDCVSKALKRNWDSPASGGPTQCTPPGT